MTAIKATAKREKFASATWTKTSAEVKALHVMLVPDGNSWFAQGLEIDYAACGSNPDEAKNNFAQGLGMTVCEHLVMYGHIKKVLVTAPQEAWNEYYQTPAEGIRRHTRSFLAYLEGQVTEQKTVEKVAFPFPTIEFLKAEPQAVAA